MNIIRNLLPEDSRLAEIAASIALLFMSLLLSNGMLANYELYTIQRYEFWCVSFFCLGIMQFASLTFYPQMEILRCITSIISGGLFIWLSLFDSRIDINDITTFSLGCANFYAFIINTAQIHKKWEI